MVYKNSSYHTIFNSTMFEYYMDVCFVQDNKEEQKEIFIEKNFFMGSRNNCSANNGIGDICDHVK